MYKLFMSAAMSVIVACTPVTSADSSNLWEFSHISDSSASISGSYSSETSGVYSDSYSEPVKLTAYNGKVSQSFKEFYESLCSQDSVSIESLMSRESLPDGEWKTAKWTVGDDGVLTAYLISRDGSMCIMHTSLKRPSEVITNYYEPENDVSIDMIKKFTEEGLFSMSAFKEVSHGK